MTGHVSLFVDKRLAFWASACYFTQSLMAGSEEEDAIDGGQAVFAAILDEMDFSMEEEYYILN